MTIYAITVPKWGLEMDEGTVANWLVAEGTVVRQGDEILEIETSKIANVVEAATSGTLRRIVAAGGEVKAVGALIGVLSDADEPEAEIARFIDDFQDPVREGSDGEGPVADTGQSIDVNGRATRFRVLPAANEQGLAPAVLIHGFGGDVNNWMFNEGAWAQDRLVAVIELPGHGGTSKDVGDGSFELLARHVLKFIDLQGYGKVHLVGHSMGAGVALTVARLAPEKVLSLSAVCGLGFGSSLNQDYIEQFIGAQKKKDMKPVVELLFADVGLITRELVDDLVDYKRIDGVPEALRTLADNALSTTSVAELDAATSMISVPILRIFAEQDQIVPAPAPGENVLANAGHMAHIERAEEVNQRVARFLKEHD
jgi:pyruvate dehydrogenase E2 component (dihydrolipoamide acetyltransferase)